MYQVKLQNRTKQKYKGRTKRIKSNDTLNIKIDALPSYQFADTNSGIILAVENGGSFFMLPDYKLQKQIMIFRVTFGHRYS